jgi:hypothetical protein
LRKAITQRACPDRLGDAKRSPRGAVVAGLASSQVHFNARLVGRVARRQEARAQFRIGRVDADACLDADRGVRCVARRFKVMSAEQCEREGGTGINAVEIEPEARIDPVCFAQICQGFRAAPLSLAQPGALCQRIGARGLALGEQCLRQ